MPEIKKNRTRVRVCETSSGNFLILPLNRRASEKALESHEAARDVKRV